MCKLTSSNLQQQQPTSSPSSSSSSFSDSNNNPVTTNKNDDDNEQQQQQQQQHSYYYGFFGQVWPLPTPIAIGLMAILMPYSLYINRGFTVWFHHIAFLYLLTKSKWIAKFQILVGTGICLGWYATVFMDSFFVSGKFYHLLYRNMPPKMVELMFIDPIQQTQLNFNSLTAISNIILSIILDLLGHPLLTYYFYCQHQKNVTATTSSSASTTTDTSTLLLIKTLLSWDVILSAWIFSRCWSITHTYYNFGLSNVKLYYFGYDIYVTDSLDLWYPAYVAESLFYLMIVIYKFIFEEEKEENFNVIIMSKEEGDDNEKQQQPPTLVWSESSISQDDSSIVHSSVHPVHPLP